MHRRTRVSSGAPSPPAVATPTPRLGGRILHTCDKRGSSPRRKSTHRHSRSAITFCTLRRSTSMQPHALRRRCPRRRPWRAAAAAAAPAPPPPAGASPAAAQNCGRGAAATAGAPREHRSARSGGGGAVRPNGRSSHAAPTRHTRRMRRQAGLGGAPAARACISNCSEEVLAPSQRRCVRRQRERRIDRRGGRR